MNDKTIFDDTLFNILKECQNLPIFLDTIFGFLSRRTDFYCIASDPQSQVGLPTGWSENFVKNSYFKWKPADEDETIRNKCVNIRTDGKNSIVSNISSADSKQCNKVETKLEASLKNDFTQSECYNGAVFENYSWSQTINEIDIIIKVPENVSSKNLSVSILPNNIAVTLKDSNMILLSGKLCQKVKNDAIWSLEKQKLEIHLEKLSEIWWDCLVQSEPKIDVTKIDCSRPLEELPEEAQAKIEELTWNQERKRLGLPTSDQLILQEKLKNSWSLEGSPFKEPFDPNTVIINP